MAGIDRTDGRHWCNPAAAEPDARGRWDCDCGRGWRRDWDGVWREKGTPVPPEPEQRGDGESLETTEEQG